MARFTSFSVQFRYWFSGVAAAETCGEIESAMID
jgi:hypothetical protein